jgi:hypothetical protein
MELSSQLQARKGPGVLRLGRSLEAAIRGKGKGEGKIHPRKAHECPEGEWRFSSTLSLTSALDGVGGQRHASAALPPGKTRYALYRRLGGIQGRSGQVRQTSPLPEFDPWTAQPVASRFIDMV